MQDKNRRDFYKNIGRAWCPALNDYVAFTSAGLRHLIRKGGKRRSNSEQARRFLLLPYAKEIVESSAVEVVHGKDKIIRADKRHGATVLIRSHADFWTLTKTYGDTAITVVVRQLAGKEKHFFSIYNAKPKNQKTAS